MRIDLTPILLEANWLLAVIEDKSMSRARHSAHQLICSMPSPCWAETATGCAIYYGNEADMNEALNTLRINAMVWLAWLLNESIMSAPDPEWPTPRKLSAAIQKLSEFAS